MKNILDIHGTCILTDSEVKLCIQLSLKLLCNDQAIN